MYNILIVDDESFVRSSIVSKIQWNQLGFQVIGEAENGLEALDLLEKNTVHVVMTDIRMPFMDGLGLSQQMKKDYPNTKVIFLTGFDDFEYAKEAVNLNIYRYILKPVTAKELTAMVEELKEQLDEEFREKKNVDILRRHLSLSKPYVEERLWSMLLTDQISSKDFISQLNNLDLPLNEGQYGVSTMVVKEKELLESELFQMPKDHEILKFAIHNIIKEILGRLEPNSLSFIHQQHIIICHQIESHQSKNKAIRTLEEILKGLDHFLNYKGAFGLGSFSLALEHTPLSYREAQDGWDYSAMAQNSGVYYLPDFQPKHQQRLYFEQEEQQLMMNLLKFGHSKPLIKALEGLFNKIPQSIPFLDYQLYVLDIFTLILHVARQHELAIPSLLQSNHNIYLQFNQLKDRQDMANWLTGLALKIQKSIVTARRATNDEFISSATQLIHQKLQDPELSVDVICQYLHVSSTYFCNLFKKEMGMTCLKYITHLRMKKAKELLTQTALRSYEIAEQVGYADPNYFSYCFKKNIGKSPLKYREEGA